MAEYYDEDTFDEPIEAYCVRCKETVEVEEPQAVWTRKGMPATRGECPICGGTVFRMGKTHLHSDDGKPSAVAVTPDKRKPPRLEQDTAYVAYAPQDEAIARQVAEDLAKSGIASWLHEHDEATVAWAGGVHPALKQCSRLVVVLSPAALGDDATGAAWRFFKEQRKPVVIAQVAPAEPPDVIRRSPRFDLSGDYRAAFRQMIQALSG